MFFFFFFSEDDDDDDVVVVVAAAAYEEVSASLRVFAALTRTRPDTSPPRDLAVGTVVADAANVVAIFRMLAIAAQRRERRVGGICGVSPPRRDNVVSSATLRN